MWLRTSTDVYFIYFVSHFQSDFGHDPKTWPVAQAAKHLKVPTKVLFIRASPVISLCPLGIPNGVLLGVWTCCKQTGCHKTFLKIFYNVVLRQTCMPPGHMLGSLRVCKRLYNLDVLLLYIFCKFSNGKMLCDWTWNFQCVKLLWFFLSLSNLPVSNFNLHLLWPT